LFVPLQQYHSADHGDHTYNSITPSVTAAKTGFDLLVVLGGCGGKINFWRVGGFVGQIS
jgi:hypothetical protein